MSSEGSGSDYLLNRAVEEPIEATFELGENIRDISSRSGKPIIFGILGYIILVIFMLPSVYYILANTISGILGGKEFNTWLILQIIAQGIIIIFLLSITLTSIIYLVQIHKFNNYLIQRYSLVDGLTSAKLSPERSLKTGDDRKDTKIGEKHLRNPIFAMLDLVEESMHELSQIIKLLRFCTYFISIIVIFLLLTAITKLAANVNLLFVLGYWELLFGIIAAALFILALKLLVVSENHFRYIKIRHSIIDGIRFEEDISVPEGENQVKRLIIYLKENDPYIKSSSMARKDKFSEKVVIKGQSGKEHGFDAHFSGLNILKEKSVSLGMPMGKFMVFITVIKGDITLDELINLREAVMDVCKKENAFPLRIIALQWEIMDLKDDVYDFVLENPIIWKNTLTHIQIAAEDQDVYSFIPMISYGKGAG